MDKTPDDSGRPTFAEFFRRYLGDVAAQRPEQPSPLVLSSPSFGVPSGSSGGTESTEADPVPPSQEESQRDGEGQRDRIRDRQAALLGDPDWRALFVVVCHTGYRSMVRTCNAERIAVTNRLYREGLTAEHLLLIHEDAKAWARDSAALFAHIIDKRLWWKQLERIRVRGVPVPPVVPTAEREAHLAQAVGMEVLLRRSRLRLVR